MYTSDILLSEVGVAWYCVSERVRRYVTSNCPCFFSAATYITILTPKTAHSRKTRQGNLSYVLHVQCASKPFVQPCQLRAAAVQLVSHAHAASYKPRTNVISSYCRCECTSFAQILSRSVKRAKGRVKNLGRRTCEYSCRALSQLVHHNERVKYHSYCMCPAFCGFSLALNDVLAYVCTQY